MVGCGFNEITALGLRWKVEGDIAFDSLMALHFLAHQVEDPDLAEIKGFKDFYDKNRFIL